MNELRSDAPGGSIVTNPSGMDWRSYSLGLISGVAASALTAASQAWFDRPAQQGTFLLGVTALGLLTLGLMRCALVPFAGRMAVGLTFWAIAILGAATSVVDSLARRGLVNLNPDVDAAAHQETIEWMHAATPLAAAALLAVLITAVKTPRPEVVATIQDEFARQLMDGKTYEEAIVLATTRAKLRRRTVELVIERSIDTMSAAVSNDHGGRTEDHGGS